MKLFIVKIQLNNHKDPDDYNVLHAKLYEKEYYQTVYLTSGYWHDLPRAMYIKRAAANRSQILNQIKTLLAITLPGFKAANIATDDEESYEIVLTMSALSHANSFEAKFILKRTTDSGKLPPGVAL